MLFHLLFRFSTVHIFSADIVCFLVILEYCSGPWHGRLGARPDPPLRLLRCPLECPGIHMRDIFRFLARISSAFENQCWGYCGLPMISTTASILGLLTVWRIHPFQTPLHGCPKRSWLWSFPSTFSDKTLLPNFTICILYRDFRWHFLSWCVVFFKHNTPVWWFSGNSHFWKESSQKYVLRTFLSPKQFNINS